MNKQTLELLDMIEDISILEDSAYIESEVI
jgi:hypothetical protein